MLYDVLSIISSVCSMSRRGGSNDMTSIIYLSIDNVRVIVVDGGCDHSLNKQGRCFPLAMTNVKIF